MSIPAGLKAKVNTQKAVPTRGHLHFPSHGRGTGSSARAWQSSSGQPHEPMSPLGVMPALGLFSMG